MTRPGTLHDRHQLNLECDIKHEGAKRVSKLSLRASKMLRDDPDEAVVRLAADEEAVQVGLNEDDHHVELGENTVDLCDALCNGLHKQITALTHAQVGVCAVRIRMRVR